MNNIANYIKQRLSLREPLQESLDITSRLADVLLMKKPPSDPDEATAFLNAELDKIKDTYPTCVHLSRENSHP